jgi:hypothetical protein
MQTKSKKTLCKKAHFPIKQEADIYASFATWFKTDKPLIVVWYMLNAELIGDRYKVPSFSDDGIHWVNIISGECDCKGFLAKGSCNHLKACSALSVMTQARKAETKAVEAIDDPVW